MTRQELNAILVQDAIWKHAHYGRLGSYGSSGSWVYFIAAVGSPFVKIGWAVSPRKRLAELQTGCPHVLRMEAAIAGSRLHEAAFHDRFGHLHFRGEWFRRVGDLALFVDELRTVEASRAD